MTNRNQQFTTEKWPNNTFNGTFASAGQFAVRSRSLYRKSAITRKGPLTRR